MSNEDYIASGMLELYAAGGLTPAERSEVESRAAASAEVRAALQEVCDAMEHYARLYAVPPQPYMKEKVLSALNKTAGKEIQPPPDQQDKKIMYIYPEKTNPNATYKWMMAASVGLFLVTGGLSIFFYNRWQQAEDQLAFVAASERQMAGNIRTTSLKTQQLEQALAVLRNPDFKSVKLQAVNAGADADMLVYWNPEQQQVYVDAIRLPVPPAGMQYQLWALENGKPVDAGMIPLGQDELLMQEMKPIQAAQAFAVTIEPVGGSKSPHLEQLMVMGEV